MFQVTPKERTALYRHADGANMSFSSWARDCLLAAAGTLPQQTAMDLARQRNDELQDEGEEDYGETQ